MEAKKVLCKECKKEFTVTGSSRFQRKFCDSCSKKRKKDYENLYTVEFEDCVEE
ncbi:MAG: hypothetical protein WC867_02825 [Candidatus Pacearchaeota archaeon]|jgi:hypothetical protein